MTSESQLSNKKSLSNSKETRDFISTHIERQTETDFRLLAHYEIVYRDPPPCKELFQSLLNIVRIIIDEVLCIPLKVSYVRIFFFLLLYLNMKCPIGLTGLIIWSPADERSTSLGSALRLLNLASLPASLFSFP